MELRNRLLWYRRELDTAGLWRLPMFKSKVRHARRSSAGSVAPLETRHCRTPLHARGGTSDLSVFYQIFVEREYACLDDVQDVRFIIDCGANVGYSSAYLLNRFPQARLIAIEPDADNYRMLEINLAPYRDRCTLIQAGVWSRSTGLVVSPVRQGSADEWGITVRECLPGETAMVDAVDLGSLLAASGESRISILKIDIEGSEREVFASNVGGWIDRFDNLVIELHGDECETAVRRALQGQAIEYSTSGELTVCKRTQPPVS
ncbi:MAG: FkbM family methyltransferase [Pseudomonadota bacterium]